MEKQYVYEHVSIHAPRVGSDVTKSNVLSRIDLRLSIREPKSAN